MKLFMKVIIPTVIITAVIYYVFIAPKATGKNIDVYSENKSTVFFHPVCPDCDHVSELYEVHISKGESHSASHMCEKCFSVYRVEIER